MTHPRPARSEVLRYVALVVLCVGGSFALAWAAHRALGGLVP